VCRPGQLAQPGLLGIKHPIKLPPGEPLLEIYEVEHGTGAGSARHCREGDGTGWGGEGSGGGGFGSGRCGGCRLDPLPDGVEQDSTGGNLAVAAVGGLDHVPGRRGGVRVTERTFRHPGERVKQLEMLPVTGYDTARFSEFSEPLFLLLFRQV
jgi:hypothetical protein